MACLRLMLLAIGVATALDVPALAQMVVKRKYREQLLAALPSQGEGRASLRISPDLRHVAFVKSAGDHQMVVLDGREQSPYDSVPEVFFSPDGKHLAYPARQKDQWFVVSDGQTFGPYVRVGMPVFSPDSSRLAFVALLPDGKRTIVVDGKSSLTCDEVFEGWLIFSPDSQQLALGVRKGAGWFVLRGDQQWGPFEFLGSASGIQYSGDSRHLAFAALQAGKWHAVLDGRILEPHDNLGELALSRDGKRLAYAAQDGKTWRVVVDGKPQAPFQGIGEGTLRFSPDGSRLVYAAQTGPGWSVVLDGKAGPAYAAIGQILFSPDGRSLAYVAKTGTSETVVRDGQPERAFDRVGDNTLVFSRGGRRLAYIARSGRATFVVADGKRKPRYDMAGYLTFTPDGRLPVYAAVKDGKAFTVVEDQQSAHHYDEIWMPPGTALLFVSPTRFRYLGVKQDQLFLVEEEL